MPTAREIQIGLPSADVNVLENGMLVTYATNPHTVNTLWRADASLSHVGLLKISETAITTGNIGYAVNSFTQLGEKGFHGTLNYKSNHFGLQEFSLNVNGGIAKDWYTAEASTRTSTRERSKSNRLRSRTVRKSTNSPLPNAITTTGGEFTAIYHYSNSHPVYNYATQSAPFIYVGDGSVREFGDFALGTTSYLPMDNEMIYRDMRTGEVKQTNLYDAAQNIGSMATLMNTYTWDNGLSWKAVMKYDHSTGSCVYQNTYVARPERSQNQLPVRGCRRQHATLHGRLCAEPHVVSEPWLYQLVHVQPASCRKRMPTTLGAWV